jgi:hypothetical protein
MTDGVVRVAVYKTSTLEFDNRAAWLRQSATGKLDGPVGRVNPIEVVAGQRFTPVRPAKRCRRCADNGADARLTRQPHQHVAVVVAVNNELRAVSLQRCLDRGSVAEAACA